MGLPQVSTSQDSLIPGDAAIGYYQDARHMPPGAIPISKSQMIEKLLNHVQEYEPRSQMWPFTYGVGSLGGLAAMSGVIINTMYRQKLRLLPHSRLSSYLPIVVLPCVSAMALHHLRVTQPVLIKDYDCAVCAEVQAVTAQTLSGWLMPASLSILNCLALARTKYTYPIPNMRDITAMRGFLAKTLKPLSLSLTILLASNIILSVFITQQEMNLVPKVWTVAGLQPSRKQLNQSA